MKKIIAIFSIGLFFVIFYLNGFRTTKAPESIQNASEDKAKSLPTQKHVAKNEDPAMPTMEDEDDAWSNSSVPGPPDSGNTSHAMPSGTSLSGEEPRKLFDEAADRALRLIPSRQDIQELSDEDLHYTPEQFFAAGSEIGKIAELVGQHPELKDQGVHFFQTCLGTEEFPDTVRALCFSHLKRLDPSSISSQDLPDEVRHLADYL